MSTEAKDKGLDREASCYKPRRAISKGEIKVRNILYSTYAAAYS